MQEFFSGIFKQIGLKEPAPGAKLDELCLQLFQAIVDPQGVDKAYRATQARIAIDEADAEIQTRFLMVCIDKLPGMRHDTLTKLFAANTLFSNLLQKRLVFFEDDIKVLIDFWMRVLDDNYLSDLGEELLKPIESYLQTNGLSNGIKTKLLDLSKKIGQRTNANELKKLRQYINVLAEEGDSSVAKLVPEEVWSDLAIADLNSLVPEVRNKWDAIFNTALALTSTTPAKKWLKEAEQELDSLGRDEFKTRIERWFPLIGKRGTADRPVHMYSGDPNELIASPNVELLKGLVWMCVFYKDDDDVACLLGDVAHACFKKIPNVGARCPKLANACVSVLSAMLSKESITQLSRLKAGAKKPSAKKQIDKGLDSAAERSGTTVSDLEELSVPDFSFTEVGKLARSLGDFQAEIELGGTHGAELRWRDASGRVLASIPAAVKKDFANEVKELKKTVTEIQHILPSIKLRIESSLLRQRHWNFQIWRERYLDHPICGAFARKLIWKLNGQAGFWQDGKIVDVEGHPLEIDPGALVELWHPIGASSADVAAWRQWMIEYRITQPFKQAHREIYVLTDAEVQSEIYSNRFAAHILRQHQFAELAKQRGWKYTLQGNWNSANTPELLLPEWNLRAEFYVQPAENEISESGVFVNLSSDQVRFSRLNNRDVVNLTEILPIVFTEVMRDVDLFVGVCSVGNDPSWQDGGAHHGYWASYSFGNLAATALTRKEVLQSIIPHLHVASRCSFSDKFLVVKGDIRTYNIHLGSGNIMMEPNGQYLCIVPSSADKRPLSGDIVLPFEGDRTMSIILSKCLMLADDTNIKDQSIVSQIKRS